jgi:ferredoxin/flavodoxin---NADP+ reductase
MTQPVTLTRSRVVALNRLCATGYELLLERSGIQFTAGQLINLHGRDHFEDRSYTVCSGEQDEHLTVLFRHVPEGVLTPQLIQLKPGDLINISGPYGEFTLRDRERPVIFFATGTGVAPCRAYLRSFSGLNLTLYHGVRFAEDLYYRQEFQSVVYHPCVSRASTRPGIFPGRVTDLARTSPFPPDSHFYLCGANEMIYEMQEVLHERGVPPDAIFTEAYYYRFDDT